MKPLVFSLLLVAPLVTTAAAQNAPIFPKGEKSTPVHHVGDVWLSELSGPDSTFTFSLAQAVFAPNARLDWHSHPGGQILLFTDGEGYYQERGKPRQTLRKGEIVKCQPGVEHWHGATPTSGVTYLATSPTQEGRTIWFKRVTDEEYAMQIAVAQSGSTNTEQAVIELSKDKWQWMADKDVEKLARLFDDKSMFVHMGGSWGKTQELDVIKSGNIWYKNATVHSTTFNQIGNTAILLSDIDLVAVVGGNEVVNPFMVTEVYVNENGNWTMGQLSFSRLMRPVKK